MKPRNEDTPAYQNKAYREMEPDWVLAGDAFQGTRTIRAKERLYLPQFPKERDDAYQERLTTSVFFNGFAKTVKSLVGLALQAKPTLGDDVAPEIQVLLEMADDAGNEWVGFAKELLTWAIRDGHAFLYVDMPGALDRNAASLADERALGIRPYWCKYQANQALSWRFEKSNSRHVLSQIVFEETRCVPEGLYGETEVTQYRVIRKREGVQPGEPGVEFQVWQSNRAAAGTEQEWVLVESGTIALDEIPVAVVYGQKTGEMTSMPPLKDQLDLNFAHYRIQSDLWNIQHWANVPVLVRIGADTTSPVSELGPGALWDVPAGGDMKYVEHHGYAMGSTESTLKNIEIKMEMLGLSLVSDKNAQTTATEEVLDAVKETSDLETIVHSLDDCLEAGLRYMAMFLGMPDGGSINFESAIKNIGAAQSWIPVLSAAVAAGQLPLEMMWDVLLRRGELPSGYSVESIQKLLDSEKAQAMAAMPPALTQSNPMTPMDGDGMPPEMTQ